MAKRRVVRGKYSEGIVWVLYTVNYLSPRGYIHRERERESAWSEERVFYGGEFMVLVEMLCD